MNISSMPEVSKEYLKYLEGASHDDLLREKISLVQSMKVSKDIRRAQVVNILEELQLKKSLVDAILDKKCGHG